ncbi:MAG: hypothetical protein KKC30_02935 [Proteobacteria bacterium]|nr:hypothetical protein [Pseudomonadota bacterium]MBU4384686.1 hypothetical protein [Pseudomonadota bacterium]MCG2765611.1 hypothetical protein [Desulfarculaceae bacterium]
MVALLLCAALPAGAETFLVLGRAPLDGNEAQAKDKAVADALVRAVAQAAAATLDPVTLRSNLATLDQQVLKDAKRFITNYSLVASAPSGQEFLALVSVSIDDRSLTKSLIQAALKLPTSHLGTIMVMVSEETAPGRPPVYWWSGLPGAPDAPAPVAKVIKKMGLRIINPTVVKPLLTPDMQHPVLSESQALEFARQVGAQVVIIGTVRTYPLVTPQHVLPPPLVQLLALETNEGQVVSMEETDSPVFHTTPTPEDAGEVVDIVESSVRRLMANLAARMAEVGPTTKDLSLKVSGVRSLSQLMRLETVLGSLKDLVDKVQRVSAGAGQAEFKLTLKGSPAQLADQLMVQDYGDFLVNVVESDAKGLQVVIIPRQPGSAPPSRPGAAAPAPAAATGQSAAPQAAPSWGGSPQTTPPGQ